MDPELSIHILDTAEQMFAIEDLQRQVWPGNDTEIVPAHLLVTAAHNGGLVLGAYQAGSLIGFAFGFPGLYETPDGPRLKHCSHMLGVHPDYRDHGIGYLLKRAQWQYVRHQGIDRITWTYDPLLSRNAHLNIARLGAVCNTYKREVYGPMRDGLNIGLPSDRFQVDWWVLSSRVSRRLSKKPRPKLELAHYLEAETPLLNPTRLDRKNRWPLPDPAWSENLPVPGQAEALALVEIPADFMALKTADNELGFQWRMHSREIFETLFKRGYLVTDFIYLPGEWPRSFYVLSYGESTL